MTCPLWLHRASQAIVLLGFFAALAITVPV